MWICKSKDKARWRFFSRKAVYLVRERVVLCVHAEQWWLAEPWLKRSESVVVRQRHAVVKLSRSNLPLLVGEVVKCTEGLPWAVPVVCPIRARHGLVVQGVVELLLRTVRVLAAESVKATVLVVLELEVLLPGRTRLAAVLKMRRTPKILICVGIDTLMPVVLYTIRTPESLEAIHVEVILVDPFSCLLVMSEQLRLKLLS